MAALVLVVQVVLVPFEVAVEGVPGDDVLRCQPQALHYLIEGQLAVTTDGAKVIPLVGGRTRSEGKGI